MGSESTHTHTRTHTHTHTHAHIHKHTHTQRMCCAWAARVSSRCPSSRLCGPKMTWTQQKPAWRPAPLNCTACLASRYAVTVSNGAPLSKICGWYFVKNVGDVLLLMCGCGCDCGCACLFSPLSCYFNSNFEQLLVALTAWCDVATVGSAQNHTTTTTHVR